MDEAVEAPASAGLEEQAERVEDRHDPVEPEVRRALLERVDGGNADPGQCGELALGEVIFRSALLRLVDDGPPVDRCRAHPRILPALLKIVSVQEARKLSGWTLGPS